MFLRSLISVLIVTTAITLAFGQTPEAKKDKEKAVQALGWAFEGDGSYLGVQTREVTAENFAKFGLREVRGVAVEKVIEKSPAATAGLQNGDVIVRFNGEEVTSARKLTRLIGEVAPDHQAKVTIIRSGSEQDIAVTIGKRQSPFLENGGFNVIAPGKIEMPDMKDLPALKDLPRDGTPRVWTLPNGEGRAFAWTPRSGRQIGIGISPLTKQLAEHFGVEGGVMISEVRENSPAAKAGLKAGDIISEAGGKAVNGEFDLIRTINETKEGDVTLTIVRDGKRQMVSVTPEAAKDNGFVFETGGEDGMTVAPGSVKVVRPAMPAMPVTAPMPLVRPGRVI